LRFRKTKPIFINLSNSLKKTIRSSAAALIDFAPGHNQTTELYPQNSGLTLFWPRAEPQYRKKVCYRLGFRGGRIRAFALPSWALCGAEGRPHRAGQRHVLPRRTPSGCGCRSERSPWQRPGVSAMTLMPSGCSSPGLLDFVFFSGVLSLGPATLSRAEKWSTLARREGSP
jgi:hypothetical protein